MLGNLGDPGGDLRHSTHEYLAVEVNGDRTAGEPTNQAADTAPDAAGGGGVAEAAAPAPPPLRPLDLPHPQQEQQQQATGDASDAGDAVGTAATTMPLQAQWQGRAGGGWSGGGNGGSSGLDLWRPLRYDQQASWRWVDWARYYFYRQDFSQGPRRGDGSSCL
jgi:hypothetical protein